MYYCTFYSSIVLYFSESMYGTLIHKRDSFYLPLIFTFLEIDCSKFSALTQFKYTILIWETQKQPQEVLYKKVLVKVLQISQEKESPTQVFSCQICEIFKNSNFEEHLGTTASRNNKINSNTKLPFRWNSF